MRNKFKQQKSSQISLRADCHSWRSGLGWQTLCGVNRCNITQGAKVKNKEARGLLREPIAIVGGVGGIRTHARGKPSNDLANRPLQPA